MVACYDGCYVLMNRDIGTVSTQTEYEVLDMELEDYHAQLIMLLSISLSYRRPRLSLTRTRQLSNPGSRLRRCICFFSSQKESWKALKKKGRATRDLTRWKSVCLAIGLRTTDADSGRRFQGYQLGSAISLKQLVTLQVLRAKPLFCRVSVFVCPRRDICI